MIVDDSEVIHFDVSLSNCLFLRFQSLNYF